MKTRTASIAWAKSNGVLRGRSWQRVALIGLLAAGVVSAVADDKAKITKKKPTGPPEAVATVQQQAPAKTKMDQKQVITGSHIPTKIKRYGRTADTSSLVYVLYREDLERSGAANVGSALRGLPFAH